VVYTKVSELIDPHTGYWDLDLLSSLFMDVDVGRILEIPLHNQGFDDFIAWNFNKNGHYIQYAQATIYNGDIPLVHGRISSLCLDRRH
jgi:hypothetical protein